MKITTPLEMLDAYKIDDKILDSLVSLFETELNKMDKNLSVYEILITSFDIYKIGLENLDINPYLKAVVNLYIAYGWSTKSIIRTKKGIDAAVLELHRDL